MFDHYAFCVKSTYCTHIIMSYTFFKDHLSSNILMCAMLLLFYASGTVEGML